MKNLKCDQCGRRLPVACFVERIEEYLCEDCASGAFAVCGEDIEPDWGDVIPIHGEISPDECADYPTHPARVAEDEAKDEADYQRANLVWSEFADQDAHARRDAYETFEAEAGAAEWQPSAVAKELVKELNG